MDVNALAEFGIQAGLVLIVVSIVKPTVDQLKGAFELEGRQTFIMAYALSMILTVLLGLVSDPMIVGVSAWASAVVVLKGLIGGWFAATYAGQMTDAQQKVEVKRAKKNAVPESDDPPIVPQG